MVSCVRVCLLLAGLALAVMNAAATPANKDVLLEVELLPAQVYVQAQAVYRMRFFQAVDVRDLKIVGPSARLAEVRPIGTDTVNETQRDGRRYRVHERRFAVFPFGSGALELTGARVEGRVAAVGATSTDGREPLRLDAPVQKLWVRPVPAALDSTPWLPARELKLSESWEPADLQAKAGQVLRRQIRIEAMGVDAAQIPPVELEAAGVLIHPEAVKLENRSVGDVNLGVREQTFRVIALRDGAIVLPQVRLPWWRLSDDALTYASLASHTLNVRPGDANTAPFLTPPLARVPESQPTPYFSWRLTATAALVAVLLILTWFKRKPLGVAWRLRRACQSGQATAVRDALLEWAQVFWPKNPPMTLEALGHRLNDPLAQHALTTIDRLLYGPTPRASDVLALTAAVRTIKRASPGGLFTQI